jgi:hypothetical protein
LPEFLQQDLTVGGTDMGMAQLGRGAKRLDAVQGDSGLIYTADPCPIPRRRQVFVPVFWIETLELVKRQARGPYLRIEGQNLLERVVAIFEADEGVRQ